MKKQFSMMNTMCKFASSMNACFAAAICLIMMGAISMVSIILLIGVALLINLIVVVVLPLIIFEENSRKRTMVACIA